MNKTKEVMGFMDYIGCFTMCEYLVDMTELIQGVIDNKKLNLL